MIRILDYKCYHALSDDKTVIAFQPTFVIDRT